MKTVKFMGDTFKGSGNIKIYFLSKVLFWIFEHIPLKV